MKKKYPTRLESGNLRPNFPGQFLNEEGELEYVEFQCECGNWIDPKIDAGYFCEHSDKWHCADCHFHGHTQSAEHTQSTAS